MVKRAFTLIEVLIMILIIAVIFVIMASVMTDKLDKELSDLQSQSEQYQQTIDSYKEDN